jgi:hypothetical protein
LLFKSTREAQISQAFGRWLDDIADWEWYATLTFRDPENPRYPGWTKIGWKFAHNALRSFNHALVMELPGINAIWVSVMEVQRRGVPHWHMLIANVSSQRRMFWVDWWFEHYGIARILPYDPELGARYYLGKYLTKEIADIQFSPLLRGRLPKLVSASGNLPEFGCRNGAQEC